MDKLIGDIVGRIVGAAFIIATLSVSLAIMVLAVKWLLAVVAGVM